MRGCVIKAAEARTLSRGMYSIDLRDIARQASEVVDAARVEADRIIAQARERAELERREALEAARREGYEVGLAEGDAAGRAQALAEATERYARDQASLTSALTELMTQFAAQREQFFVSARRDAVVLGVAIARRVISRLAELGDTAGDAAAAACAEALALLRGASGAVVRVHPEDQAAVQQFAGDLARTMSVAGDVRVVEDASVGRGGCVVQAEDCVVDATAAGRVARISDELVADWRARLRELSVEA